MKKLDQFLDKLSDWATRPIAGPIIVLGITGVIFFCIFTLLPTFIH